MLCRYAAPLCRNGLLVDLLSSAPKINTLANGIMIEQQLDLAPCGVRRLAFLALHHSQDAGRLQQKFRLSNKDKTLLEAFAPRRITLAPSLAGKPLRVLCFKEGKTSVTSAILNPMGPFSRQISRSELAVFLSKGAPNHSACLSS